MYNQKQYRKLQSQTYTDNIRSQIQRKSGEQKKKTTRSNPQNICFFLITILLFRVLPIANRIFSKVELL